MITLRKINLNDSKFFLKNLLDKDVHKSYKHLPQKISLVEVKKQIEKIKDNCFIIEVNRKPIGMRYFWEIKKDLFDIGSWITKKCRRQGYGSKAFFIFVSLFNKQVEFRTRPINEGSRLFIEDLGFLKGLDGFWYFKYQNK